MNQTSLYNPLVGEALALGPHLFLQCLFNPYYDVLDGVRHQPLTAAERQTLTEYQQHCQQALKTVYESVQHLPADRVSIHTEHTIFTITSREYVVRNGRTLIRCKCHGDNQLQPFSTYR